MNEDLPDEYRSWLEELTTTIVRARRRAARMVNAQLVELYWTLGKEILEKQRVEGWGAQVIVRLAADLHSKFPSMRGLSRRNLTYMRRFATEWPDFAIVQDRLAQLPWYLHIVLIEKLGDAELRLWYGAQATKQGWTQAILQHQIETALHLRHRRALTNFDLTLPQELVVGASDLFKDPFVLDFIDLGAEAHERHLEQALIEKLKDLMVELGKGFAFMGSQYHLSVGDDDFYLDLLFYHARLHCYVVIDLKMTAFEPEFAGKMGFYLNAVDAQLATEGDKPSIGLILCRGKNGMVVEYAIRAQSKPMAVASYTVLPEELRQHLPSEDELAGLFAGTPSKVNDNDGSDEDDPSPGPGR